MAADPEGCVYGSASVAVREDALLVLALEVSTAHRGKGVGRALLAAARAYGAARGTRALEVLAPEDPSALSFFLHAGLSLRTLVLGMAVKASAAPKASLGSLHAVGPDAPLYGWIAALDRETRGFARPRDWARWAAAGHVVSQRRGGRPAAIGAWSTGPSGAALGPIAARTPEAAAELLPFLMPRAGGTRFSLALPAEARILLHAAASLGFRAVSTRVFLTDRRRGDLRRYAGGGGRFF